MLQLLKSLFSSKKFVAALATTIAFACGYFGFEVDADKLALALAPILLFVATQGLADHQKEAAKLALEKAQVELAIARLVHRKE